MSYERREGKDKIIFLTEEDYNEPSKLNLEYDKEDEEQMGLIRPDGEINWNCPCLQGMADGPCGQEFRNSFSCFHYSEADPKGSDCIPQFKEMQECFLRHPEVYDGENVDGNENDQQDPNDEKHDFDDMSKDFNQNDNLQERSEDITDTSDIKNNNLELTEDKSSNEVTEESTR